MGNHPKYGPLESYGYIDSKWAACVQTRHIMMGAGICLAGGMVGYKTKLQPNIAGSSTKA